MKKYLSLLCMALFMAPALVACSSDDDFSFASDEEISLMKIEGKLGKEEACKLVFPDKAVIKNPFDDKFSSFNVKDDVPSLSAISSVKKPRNIEGLSFFLKFNTADVSKLKSGDKLIPSSGSLGLMFSSDSNDFMSLKGNGGAVYVRRIDGNSITVYLDHVKFDCPGGFHMTGGEYMLYGDLKLPINN